MTMYQPKSSRFQVTTYLQNIVSNLHIAQRIYISLKEKQKNLQEMIYVGLIVRAMLLLLKYVYQNIYLNKQYRTSTTLFELFAEAASYWALMAFLSLNQYRLKTKPAPKWFQSGTDRLSRNGISLHLNSYHLKS